ncbi:MAG TPA: class I SAM-dependent methyltransferase, partial [Acidimicrobiia bacterium]
MSVEHPVPTGNTYDKYGSSNPIERRLMATFLARLDDALPSVPPRRILEVGVGEGEVADRVAQRYPDAFVTGIDLPDPSLADHWSSKRFAASFADIEHLPFGDAGFDLVLAIEVLEHVPDPAAALRELR